MPVDAAAAYHFRGASADGVLKLTPAQAEFSADIVSTTAPITGGRIDKTTFAIHLSKGALGSLAVVEREADASQRSWRVTEGENAVATAVELPLMSWANPFGLVLGRMDTGASFPARVWLIRFARPATSDVTLETTATHTSPPTAEPPRLEAWSVLGATPAANANTARPPGFRTKPPRQNGNSRASIS